MSGHDAGASTAISLVVPVREEEGSLAALVDSIRRQTRPPDEVLLVDGGSTDRTVALAGEAPGTMRLMSPASTRPGPTSTNSPTPSTRLILSTESTQRTG